MSNKQISIVGCGGHSKVVSNIALSNSYTIKGYYDDNMIGEEFNNSTVIGLTVNLSNTDPNYICAIGNNNIRKLIVDNNKVNWINLIHPFTSISNDFKCGNGNVICPGVIIQPNVNIGDHCIINTKVSIDHDCTLGSFIHLAPGVTFCGTVNVDDGTFIGAGTTVKNNINIGKNVIIGCGSNVTKDIPDNVIAYGNPCKIIKDII